MLDDGLPFLGPKIDLYQIEPITPRRTLTFINYFISQTTNFLNKFATTCEERLDEIGLRIQNMEILLAILETKVASIPGLENITVETAQTSATASNEASVDKVEADVETTAAAKVVVDVNGDEGTSRVDDDDDDDDDGVKITNKSNPLYKKYFTMLSMGVLAPAIRQKMTMENVDPGILDNPNGLSRRPPAREDSQDDSSSTGSDSDSSFDD